MHKMLSVEGSPNLQLHLHQKAAGLVKSTEQLISPEFQVLGEGKKKRALKVQLQLFLLLLLHLYSTEEGKPLEYLKHTIIARLTKQKDATCIWQKQRLNKWEEIAKH